MKPNFIYRFFLLCIFCILFPVLAFAQDGEAPAADPKLLFGLGLSVLMAISALLSAALPSVSKNPFFQAVLSLLNVLGSNYGKAKNKDDDRPT